MPTSKTKPRTPPRTPSDEADQEQLQLANAQGHQYKLALEHMTQKVADDGREVAAGDYLVGYAVEKAEGMWAWKDGSLQWQDPSPDENLHVEVSVRDGADGRFVPGLEVYATLTGPDGQKIGTHQQPFLWHPWLYHYGRNWQVPGDGQYTIDVHIEPPAFMRHDQENGKRFEQAVDVTFDAVEVQTGQD